MVRAVQQARREAGLDVSDRIDLSVAGSAGLVEALETHRHWVAEATLDVSVHFPVTGASPGDGWDEVELSDGERAWVQLAKTTAS